MAAISRILAKLNLRESFVLWSRSDSVKAIATFFRANAVTLVMGIASGYVTMRLVKPESMGIWLTANTAIIYSQFAMLALPNGLNRQLPLLIGAGGQEDAQRLADTTWWWTKHIGLLFGLGLLAVGAYNLWTTRNWRLAEAWFVCAALVVVSFQTQTLEIAYRTGGDFIRLSKIKNIVSAVGLVSLVLLLVNPWYGLLARTLLLAVLQNVLLWRRSQIRFRSRFDRKGFRELFRIGWPIFAVGYVYSMFAVVDRSLIASLFGAEKVGIYAPATYTMMLLGVLPASISKVTYPLMCQRYGETGTARSLASLAFMPPLVLSVALLPVFGFGWWVIDPVIRHALPQYVEGIPAARWTLVGMYFMSLTAALNVFHTIFKLVPYAVFIALGLGAMVLTSYAGFRWLHLGVEAVAIGRSVGIAVFVILSLLGSAYYVFRPDVRSDAK